MQGGTLLENRSQMQFKDEENQLYSQVEQIMTPWKKMEMTTGPIVN